MPRKPTGNPNGRPPKQIDQITFENLCKIQCTEQEIAAIFECHIDTVDAWCKRTYGTGFSDTFKVFSSEGKASLRRTQFKLAQKSAAMAIFLGKNMLGQSDHVEIVDTAALDKLDAILGEARRNAQNEIQSQTE